MGKVKGTLPLVCVITLITALLLSGLTGCNGRTNNSKNDENSVMGLISQSRYFHEAPAELYFGEAIQESFSDRGVTVKYLSSFYDGEATYLFFDVIDTDAKLFSKGSNGFDFSLEKYEFLEKAGYTDSMMYEVISFDEKSRTATICVEYIGPLNNEDISFHVYSMNGNQKIINYTLEANLSEILYESAGEFVLEEQFRGSYNSISIIDERTGQFQNVDVPEFDEGNGDAVSRLKTDVLAIPVEDEEGNHIADITNIGWKDGWLHVQINPNKHIKWNTSFNLQSNKTEELLYSPFKMSFGTSDDQDVPDDYYEYVFYIGDMTQDNIDYSIIFRNETYRATYLTGDWEIKFTIPEALVKKLEGNKSIPVKGNELLIHKAVVSPVNITLFAARDDVPEDLLRWFHGLNPDDLDLKLIYQDGKKTTVPKQSGYTHGNQKGNMFRITYTSENFQDIACLEVNGVLFPTIISIVK